MSPKRRYTCGRHVPCRGTETYVRFSQPRQALPFADPLQLSRRWLAARRVLVGAGDETWHCEEHSNPRGDSEFLHNLLPCVESLATLHTNLVAFLLLRRLTQKNERLLKVWTLVNLSGWPFNPWLRLTGLYAGIDCRRRKGNGGSPQGGFGGREPVRRGPIRC